MTPERWQKINDVFYAALELPDDERREFIAETCASDTDLRQEVESLFASHEQATSFIDGSAIAETEMFWDDEATPPEQRIGFYKLLREIGRGGMGAVYLAVRDDDQYKKQVAIKLIKRGMDSDFILARFRNERQILANFEHPNIARLLDGGTTESGLPYFVMEYIEGLPIDEYCDKKRLSVSERLKLFREVCSAVHYAHQNLVIHRDIKPSNILVTDEGVVKLLDFGIAKMLAPDNQDYTAETATLMRLMTPEYASPEQVRGEHITTASDVYSLGIVLYELLTGHSPYLFAHRSPMEIAQVITKAEPQRPSTAIYRIDGVKTNPDSTLVELTPESVSATREGSPEKLRRRLSGDLDNIVLMALRKERERRYLSVEQFSEDLRRYLEGRTVIARQDTLSYRASKFIKRNKVAVTAAALIVLTLIGGIIATAWQAQVARRQRAIASAEQAKAERRFSEVRKLANAVLFDYHDAIQTLPGSTAIRERLVKDALQYLDSLAQEATGDATLLSELASAYERIAKLQGGLTGANLGDTEAAIESYRKALQMRESLLVTDPNNTAQRAKLAVGYRELATVLFEKGDTTGTMENYLRAVAISESLVAGEPTNRQYRYDLSINYVDLGTSLSQQGDFNQALENQRKSLSILESLLQSDTTSQKIRYSLSSNYWSLGQILTQINDTAGALENNNKAIALLEALIKEDSLNTDYRRQLYVCYSSECVIYAADNKISEALEAGKKSLALAEELAKSDAKNIQSQVDASNSSVFVGILLHQAGKDLQALPYFRKALLIREEIFKADSTNLFKRFLVIEVSGKAANSLAKTGHRVAAVELCRETLLLLEAIERNTLDGDLLNALANVYKDVAGAYMAMAEEKKSANSERQQDWQAARNWYQKGLEIWLDMQAKGRLSSLENSTIDEVKKAIVNCDAALAK